MLTKQQAVRFSEQKVQKQLRGIPRLSRRSGPLHCMRMSNPPLHRCPRASGMTSCPGLPGTEEGSPGHRQGLDKRPYVGHPTQKTSCKIPAQHPNPMWNTNNTFANLCTSLGLAITTQKIVCRCDLCDTHTVAAQ